jgi:hypothetical protein
VVAVLVGGLLTGPLTLYTTHLNVDQAANAQKTDVAKLVLGPELAAFEGISRPFNDFAMACKKATTAAYAGQVTPEDAKGQCLKAFFDHAWAEASPHFWILPVPVVSQLVDVKTFIEAEPARKSYATSDAWNAAFNQKVADVWNVMHREVYPVSQFPDALEQLRPPR